MGGTIPGITTDADAMLLAEKTRAVRLVNLSNVHGVFDSNPKDNPGAKKYDEMTHEQLSDLAVKSDLRRAGTHFVFDVLACKLAARSNIELHFVDGRKMDDVLLAISGKRHSGTIVRD
jgi:uridylate kinase